MFGGSCVDGLVFCFGERVQILDFLFEEGVILVKFKFYWKNEVFSISRWDIF